MRTKLKLCVARYLIFHEFYSIGNYDITPFSNEKYREIIVPN